MHIQPSIKRKGAGRIHIVSIHRIYILRPYNTLVLENDLRNAVKRNQLELFYQPKVSTDENKIVGVEALIRWNHPEWGLLSPGVFIPLAEETGIITEIEKWVDYTACSKIRHGKMLVYQ